MRLTSGSSQDFAVIKLVGTDGSDFDPRLVLTADLGDAVIALDLPQGLEKSLVAKLDSALQKLQDTNPNNDVVAVNKLEDFINQVEARSGRRIDEADADDLIAAAEEIIALLIGP